MGTSEDAKIVGAKDIKEVADFYSLHVDTLQKWRKNPKRTNLYKAAMQYFGEQKCES